MACGRVFRLLRQEERRRAVKVAGSVVLSSLLDFAGLAALLPVLYFLLEGESQYRAALFFGLLALTVVLVKGLLSVRLGRFQNRFLLDLYRRLSFTLFDAYCRKGLLFIREKGVSRLGFEVNNVCFAFTQSVLAPMLQMAGSTLLLVLVTVALLVYDAPTVLVLYIAFLPFMAAYIYAVRNSMRRYGEQEQLARRGQTRVVNDTFGGFQELDVNDAVGKVRNDFRKGMDRITESRLKLDTVMRMPMLLAEVAVVLGLVLLTLTVSGDVKLLVSIFAVGSFKLLPALKGILSGWTQLRHASFCLDIIEEGCSEAVTEAEPEAEVPLEWKEAITLDEVAYAYPGGRKVLEGFSCRIRKGEYVGFKGYSGVGKSTLFNLILGFLQPDSGEVRIDGVVLDASNRHAWLKHVGYVPQCVYLFDGTLAENVALGCTDIDRNRVRTILEQVSLEALAVRLPDGMDTVLSENGGRLSGGERQRIGMARALYRNMDVLLLDEATSALDNEMEKEINEVIRGLREEYRGLTVLSIAHRDGSLAYCDRVVAMD